MHRFNRQSQRQGPSVVEAIRDAVQSGCWDVVRRLWPRVPNELRQSAQGHAIWARVLAGDGQHVESGKFHYQAYIRGKDPQSLLEASFEFLRGGAWDLAGLALDSMCGVSDESHLPSIIQTLANEIELDQIFAERVKATEDDGRVPIAWFQDETFELRRRIFEIVRRVVESCPNGGSIASMTIVARAFGFEEEGLAFLKSIEIHKAYRWSRVAELASVLGRESDARYAYSQFVSVESDLPEVIPDVQCDGLPIIVLHRGDADFMHFTLGSIRKFHPHKRIVVIGDDHNRLSPELKIEYRQWHRYTKDAQVLRSRYRHRTINPYPFELLCLERWFVLNEFCREQGIDELLHLDSDVLFFDSIEPLVTQMKKYEAMTCGTQAGVGYFTGPALQRLRDTMHDFYTEPEKFPDLHGKIMHDMLFCGYVAKRDGWGDFLQLNIDGVIDNHIRTSDGYRMKNGVKDFEIRKGHPFAIRESDRRWVRFRTIHFQGPSKRLIRVFAERVARSVGDDQRVTG